MESNITALRRKNDEAAARELRELRADTLEGLKYAIELVRGDAPPAHTTLENAISIIERRWPA